MRTLKASIAPLSAFGTRPLGDTFFGQLCWALRNRLGEERLHDLLAGYTEGRPFAVVSDALPAGFLPRPILPAHWYAAAHEGDRKALKKHVWLPIGAFVEPVELWLPHCMPATELPSGAAASHPHPHNAIDRRSGTTGTDFAPYTMTRHWYGRPGEALAQGGDFASVGARLEIRIALDDSRLPVREIEQALRDIGELGFGRDASIGLGRYALLALEEATLPGQRNADAWMTLAPCAPQGLAWRAERSFYTVFTRFGRHGDMGVHSGKPFKNPVLLANTGAVLCPAAFEPRAFVGQGLGGDGTLSKAIPETVQQGYAPVVAIRLPEERQLA